MAALSSPDERAVVHQIGEISRRGYAETRL